MRKGELDALRMRIYGRQAILGMVKKRDTKVYALRTGQVEGRPSFAGFPEPVPSSRCVHLDTRSALLRKRTVLWPSELNAKASGLRTWHVGKTGEMWGFIENRGRS